jgi:hypothetical protein
MFKTTLASGTGIGARKRGQVLQQVLHAEHLGRPFVEGNTDGSTSRRDVLERGGSREIESGGKLLDESPRVESVEEVDIPRRAGNN